MSVRALLTSLAAVLASAGLLVSATSPAPATALAPPATKPAPRSPDVQPLAVRAASLTQSGQELVWTLKLRHPFSGTGLGHDHRSLCLLIERASNATVAGEVCVAPPGRGGHVRLVYRSITAAGAGPGHAVDAIVTRTSTSDLTASFMPASLGRGYGSLRWQISSKVLSPPCTSSCTILFPRRPALARLHTPVLVGCVPSGPPFVYHGATDRRVIALTFDDGPWPDTPQFLSILEREHVNATFFQIGEQVGGYGQSVDRRMLADGDVIGDHTWNHANVSGGGSFAAGEISQAAAAIQQLTGFTPCLFRAPGGAVSSALIFEARSLGFTTIQWDIDPRDWARPGTDAIYQNVISNAHAGAIVIQHDGGGDRSETLAALPREIDTLRSEGYQFVTITQLLGQQLIYR